MRAVVLALVAGCSFDPGFGAGGGDDMNGSGDGGVLINDGAVDGAADATLVDVQVCDSGMFLDLCAMSPPSGPFNLSNTNTINTDTDSRCRTVNQPSGGPVCMVYATSVNIMTGGTLIATGSRPLAIVSTSTMQIGGDIDVSSHGSQRGPSADSSLCSFATNPEPDLGGGGGGAGGSFGLHGANGGTGDTDNSQGNDGMAAPGTVGPSATVVALRGGCRGQQGGNEDATGGMGGTGGHSGGALYLYSAQSIQFSGSVRATGEGGGGGQVQAGGGGGGSGGLVVIESPSIAISGFVAANGGGGGEGGARVGMTPVSGQPGADGALGATPAPGGMGSDSRFGFGGAGGAGTTSAVAGVSAVVGGGGGGGGVGVVKLIGDGSPSVSGVISPPPS